MRLKLGLIAIALIAPAKAGEAEVQARLCKDFDMEVDLPAGARADCVSKDYAIEVDTTEKWAEALGQSLHYAAETEKRAMIYLYCKKTTDNMSCYRHEQRLRITKNAYNLPVEIEIFDEAEILAECSALMPTDSKRQ